MENALENAFARDKLIRRSRLVKGIRIQITSRELSREVENAKRKMATLSINGRKQVKEIALLSYHILPKICQKFFVMFL